MRNQLIVVCVIFVAAKFFFSFFLQKSQAKLKKTLLRMEETVVFVATV